MSFRKPEVRARIANWESVARSMVATFRAETARTGASVRTKALVDELSLSYPEFKELWLDHDVRTDGEGTKYIQHPIVGLITLEYSTFAVGRWKTAAQHGHFQFCHAKRQNQRADAHENAE